MRELDHKEGWVLKNWCFWIVVLEKTPESPLNSKEIKLVNSKVNQLWLFTGRTDAEAEAPILWPPDENSWLSGKDPDAGKDWGQEKGWRRMRLFWIASLTQWTWVWVDSRSWWRTGKPGMLQSMKSQRVGHDWATELNSTEQLSTHGIKWINCLNEKMPLFTNEERIKEAKTWPNNNAVGCYISYAFIPLWSWNA